MTDDSFDEQIDGIQDPHLLVRLLLEQGEKMSPNLRAKIITMESASIPPLIDLLNNEAIQMENAPGGGGHPFTRLSYWESSKQRKLYILC